MNSLRSFPGRLQSCSRQLQAACTQHACLPAKQTSGQKQLCCAAAGQATQAAAALGLQQQQQQQPRVLDCRSGPEVLQQLDTMMFDQDGVLWRGQDLIPKAVEV
jgi:hypothetical protein